MTKKEKLLKELAEIERKEKLEAEKAEVKKLLYKGYYKPLKRGIISDSIWNVYEGFSKELSDGYYTIDSLLGDPDFGKGDEVVLIDCEGDRYWFKKREPHEDYLYCLEDGGALEEDSDYVEQITNL